MINGTPDEYRNTCVSSPMKINMTNRKTLQNWGNGICETTVEYITRDKLKPAKKDTKRKIMISTLK